MKYARLRTAMSLGVAAAALSACSLTATESSQSSDATESTVGGDVVVVSHESFTLSDELIAAFEGETGYTIKIRAAGDAGTLATKLSLTADNPTGDAAFGIDNTFASRPLEAGAFAVYEPDLPEGADEYALEDGGDRLTPIDNGNVCLNYDKAWFEKEGVEPPTSLDDITLRKYAPLAVVPGASTSSPGMALLLATIAEKGDDWTSWWEMYVNSGGKIVDGWEDAYYGDFTAGAEKGTRPIVLSYDSSPAFTVKKGETTTAAILDSCYRQVEYAGVLEGAENPEGARAFIDFMLSDEVQSSIPELMYMFPVSSTATIPEEWAKFAEQPEEPYELAPEEIAAQREQWLTEWTDVISR